MAKKKKSLCECVQPVICGTHGYVISGVVGGEGLKLVIMISLVMMMSSMP